MPGDSHGPQAGLGMTAFFVGTGILDGPFAGYPPRYAGGSWSLPYSLVFITGRFWWSIARFPDPDGFDHRLLFRGDVAGGVDGLGLGADLVHYFRKAFHHKAKHRVVAV